MRPAHAPVEAVPPAGEPQKGGSPQASDEARKRAIARAVWTEIHWLMPRDRTVVVTVDGDTVAVEFGPPAPTAAPRRPRP